MKNDKFINHLVRRLKWDDLDENYLLYLVRTARAEDIEGAGLKEKPQKAIDITTATITPHSEIKSFLVARRDMVRCGIKLIPMILKVYESTVDGESCVFTPFGNDGDRVAKGGQIGEITGSARIILQAERIMLNFIQRLSGVATVTAEYVKALGGSQTKLLDTRKTTPCLRVLEKYAFACGGGYNHRIGLFDRVMLKDNHLVAAHAVTGDMLANAVRLAKEKNPDVAVEVEVDSIMQIKPVLKAEADVIMLDNFNYADLRSAIDIIGDKAWTEASGGVKLDNIGAIAKIGPDFVSTAAPVHSGRWIDIGLDS